MAHSCNPNTKEVEPELKAQDHSWLDSEFEASLVYLSDALPHKVKKKRDYFIIKYEKILHKVNKHTSLLS